MAQQKYKQKTQFHPRQRFIALTILFCFHAQILEVPLVKAAPLIFSETPAMQATVSTNTVAKKHWGIVAVLVENSLMQDTQNHPGIQADYPDKLKASTLADRVRRYAIDVQSAQEYTKSLIITVDKNADVHMIADALEKLYQQGDGTKDEINKLTGVVTIGNVPLPVVNKKGYKFVSMFPYTDFEDKAYVYNASSGDFEQNSDNKFSKAEVWHGVIKPPVQGTDGEQLLANFFDKNHLYHLGVPEFAQFNKKLFMADLFNEFKGMNYTAYSSYLRYLSHWEDFAYLRYSKHLAEQFYGEIQQQLTEQGITKAQLQPKVTCDTECIKQKNSRDQDFDGDGYTNGYEIEVGSKMSNGTNKPTNPRDPDSVPIDYTQSGNPIRLNPIPFNYKSNDDGKKLDYPDPPQDKGIKDSFALLPDIQSKKIIDNFVSKYVLLFDKYLGTINDWSTNTGRYVAAYEDGAGRQKTDLHTLPALIGVKDNYTVAYMRKVNDALETTIDNIIEGAGTLVGVTGNSIPGTDELIILPSIVKLSSGNTSMLSSGTYIRIADDNGGSTVTKVLNVIDSTSFMVDQVRNFIGVGAQVFLENPNKKLYGNVLMLQASTIKGTITYSSDSSDHSLDDVDFVNFATHSVGLFSKMLFINGSPISLLKNVADCTLYRGSNYGSGNNTVMVKAIRTLDPKTGGKPDDNKVYAGCYANNLNHPERCFPTRALAPVFDIKGTKEVKPGTVSDDATNYRACFDFKEKQRYEDFEDEIDTYIDGIDDADNEEAKAKVAKPGAAHKPADQIVLYDADSVKVTLADVATHFGQGDGKDNDSDGVIDNASEGDPKYGIPVNDWQQIGERILRNEQVYYFNNAFPNVKSLKLEVVPEVAKDSYTNNVYLDSVSYHKEPTAQTIGNQIKGGGISIATPIDNPRFVTFQDKSKDQTFRKVVYPNIYAAKSYDEFIQQLKNTEQDLQNVANAGGVTVNIAGQLTSVINGNSDFFSDAKKTSLVHAGTQQLQDALAWKAMGIDEKHDYVLSHYLSPNLDPYVEKMPHGYESAYFVSKPVEDPETKQTSNTLLMRFNGNFPQEEIDPIFQLANEHDAPSPTPQGGIGSAATQTEASEDGIFIFAWFGEMVQWVKDTANQLSATVSVEPSCSVTSSSLGEALPPNFEQPTVVQGGPNKPTQLRISANKNALKCGGTDTMTITIEGLAGSNVLQTGDNTTVVDLNIPRVAGKEVAKVISSHPIALHGGKATVTILSTQETGTFTVKAFSTSNSSLSSNTLTLTSTNNHIRVLSYISSTSLDLGKQNANGFIVQNDKGAIIAEVNAETGMVTIKDDRFALVALSANGAKPARLGVQEKSSGTLYASVFFVLDKTKPVTIDNPSIDYFANYKSLPKGAHVRDLDTTDTFFVENVPADHASNPSGVYLYAKDAKLGKKKTGLIDTLGNVFVDSNYGFQLKNPANSASPVVFQITDGTGKGLFEIYLAAQTPKIQILAPEGPLKDFNRVAFQSVMDQAGMATITSGVGSLISADVLSFATPSAHAQAPDSVALSDIEEILFRGAGKFSPADKLKDGQALSKGMNPLQPENTPLFKDVSPSTEGFKDIIRLYERGILKGYSDGTFRPTQAITREEFTKIDLGSICILCAQFRDTVKRSVDLVYTQNPFPDKDISEGLAYCVKESKNRNIVSGYQGGTQLGYFVPKSNITRAEAVKVILETARQNNKTSIAFTNESTEGKPWFYNYVLTAQHEKLFPKGRFQEVDTLDSPAFKQWFDTELTRKNSAFMGWIIGSITRAEFAIMSSRLIDKTDCAKDDQDHDGVPDNYEKYLFGTDLNNPDTDQGGVHDLEEIIRGTNPLDASDDMPKAADDNDGMPALWETQNKLNPYDASDANQDPDGDLLSNLEEYKYGTNPHIADTDGGGVNDSDEVLRSSNPLDATDDRAFLKGDQGGYIIGDKVFENFTYANPGNTALTSNLDFVDEIPADAKSNLILRAEVLDDKGNIDTSSDGSLIEFKPLAQNDGQYASITSTTVKVKNGVAETEIQSTSKAGEFVATAELKGHAIPTDKHSVFVTPLDPADIQLSADSPILKNGGLSNTLIHAKLVDANGNTANDDTYTLTFNVDGPGQLDTSKDENSEIDGVQITSPTGIFDVLLTSQKDPGTITVHATYKPADQLSINNSASQEVTGTVTKDLNVQTRDDLKLMLNVDKSSIPSDYATTSGLNLRVVDGRNNLVQDFRGTATFTLQNSSLGQFTSSPEQNVVSGIAKTFFQASNLAGKEEITATVPGFDPVTASITTLPKAAKQINLESSAQTIEGSPNSSADIIAKLYDTDGNFASNDSTTQVTFKLTDSTKSYATFEGPTTVQADQGEARIKIHGTSLTGPINIVAMSNDLIPGAVSLESTRLFRASTFKDLAPRTLFASFLGSDFGNIFNDNYLSGWFVFSGTPQSAVSLLSVPKPHLRIANVQANGKVEIFDSNSIDSRVIAGNSSDIPTRIVLSDPNTKEDLAEMFTVYNPAQNQITILDSSPSDSTLQKISAGITIQNVAKNSDYSTLKTSNGAAILKQGNEAAHIYNSGTIKITDNSFSLQLSQGDSEKYLTLNVVDGTEEVSKLTFAMNAPKDVTELDRNFSFDSGASLSSGTYIHLLSSKNQYQSEQSFSGNSSADPHGRALIDSTEDMPKSQAPGFSYKSLESSPDEPGIGFVGDNKFMLLFAAGNSVGESNLPYSSEIGIVIGDPTVRLNNKINVSDSGYTKDIGKEIYFGDKEIQEITNIDYNGDGLKDLLIAYKDGEVRLLQNNNGNPRFEDRGILLNFPNGIVSMTSGDFNSDGLEDLIVATQDSCRQGEVCINEYENHHGNFVLKYLPLQPFTEKNRVFMLRAADMNNDGHTDLVTSDDTGVIRVFYNRNGGFDLNGQFVGSLGLHIDPTANLKTEVLVSYDGMPSDDPSSTKDDSYFVDVPVTKSQSALTPDEKKKLGLDPTVSSDNKKLGVPDLTDSEKNAMGLPTGTNASSVLSADETAALEALQGGKADISKSAPDVQVPVPFLYLDASPSLINASKRVKNLTNANNTLGHNDDLVYTITLKSNANYTLNHLMINDAFPANMTIDSSTIVCIDCGTQKIQLSPTGQSLRPYVISGFDIPAGATRTITYSAKVNDTPRVKISVGKDLTQKVPSTPYPMIGAAPDRNSSGRMSFYYATSTDPTSQKLNWQSYTTPDPKPVTVPKTKKQQFGQSSLLSTKDFEKDSDDNGIPDIIEKYMDDQQNTDTSGNGIGDSFNDFVGGMETALDNVQNAISSLTCSQGCIPMPINYAFLAPGAINVLGVPSGFDPGLPAFAFGVPSIIPIWPPSPYQGSLGGRVYLSPTLTGSLATGLCIGPYLGGLCWAFKVADLIPTSVCDAINQEVEDGMATANNFIQSAGSSAMVQSGQGADSLGRSSTGGMAGSTNLGSYQYKGSVSTNFKIPGFPGVITKWLEDQTNEIVNKLSDLPDFYFILPDPTSLVGSFVPQDGARQTGTSGQNAGMQIPAFSSKPLQYDKFNYKAVLSTPGKILSFLNSIPLIQIQSQEVMIKIPALTAAEIAKLKADAKQWIEDERNEVNRTLQVWSCGGAQLDQNWVVQKSGNQSTSPYQTMCDKLIVDTTNLRNSVEKNINALQKYLELPRKILAWKNIGAKYIYQIICYLDTIMQFTGGYIKKQQSRILGWINMIKKVKQLLETWKLIIDLIVNYQASCDRCSSSRFTLLELILKIFAAIPSPPIVPFPKLPDIYLDVSRIQTGLKITWPDIKFVPERLIIPKLPRITLPDVPTLNIILPAIPVLPEPPDLPELPDLPGLPIPTLPDIPPPPKIPSIPGQIKAVINILNVILKILCLIRKGLMPMPELNLKSHIEQLTERPLTPLIPLDLLTKLQLPPIQYKYVDRIEIKTILNFQLNLSFIYDFVQDIADVWNNLDSDLVQAFNKKMQEAASAAAAAASKASQALPSGSDVNLDLSGESTSDLRLRAALPKNLQASDLKGYADLSQKLVETYAADYQSSPEIINLLSQISQLSDPNADVSDLLAANSQTVADVGTLDIKNVSDTGVQNLLIDFKKNDPLLGHYFDEYAKASKELQKTAEEYAKNNKEIEKDIHLVGSQRYLSKDDPLLNQPIENIKMNIAMEGKPEYSLQKQASALRNALIAYSDQGQYITSKLSETTDLAETGRILAQAGTLSDYLPTQGSQADQRFYASASTNDVSSSGTSAGLVAASLANDAFTSYVSDLKDHLNKNITLMASVGNLPDVPTTPGTESLVIQPKGIYIHNAAKNVNERLMNYTAEADSPSHILFIDVENDSDEDVVYSFGGNIYLKENYTKAPLRVYYGGDPETKDLADVLPVSPAVEGFNSNYSNNKTIDVNWKPSTDANISGYQIVYKLMPDAFTQKVSLIGHKIIALVHPQKADDLTTAYATAQDVSGNVYFDGTERTLLLANSSGVTVKAGETLHALQPTTFIYSVQNKPDEEHHLDANGMFNISKNIVGSIKIVVKDGLLEEINPAKIVQHQKLVNGVMLDFDSLITSGGGSARIAFPDGSYVRIDQGEDMIIKKLDSPGNPSLEVHIPNGFYYSKIQSFNHSGFLGTTSSMVLFSPSICADQQSPLPNGGPAERTTSIYKAVTIDASKSFDTNGKIISYFLDTDLTTDSDHDSDPTNDKNVCHDADVIVDSDGDGIPNNDCDDPVFKVGPYQDLNDRKVMLNVLDESLNRSQQEITIHVTVPGIQMSQDTATEGIAKGNIDIAESEIPVSVIRDRSGVLTPIITKTANAKGKYFTDEKGDFRVNDLNLNDTVVIKNAEGKVIGEINPKTGRILLTDPNYDIAVMPAEMPLLPTRVIVKQKSDSQIIATVFLVPDMNVDTTIDNPTLAYNSTTTAVFTGVHIKDDNGFDDFVFHKIPTDDPSYPGATEIINQTNKERAALLDTGGNFYRTDSRLSLKLSEATDLKDPLVIQILFTKDAGTPPVVLGEFVIATHTKKGVQLLPEEKFKEFTQTQIQLPEPHKVDTIPPVPKSAQDEVPFKDLNKDNPYYQSILNLYQRHVLDDLLGNATDKANFGPELPILRAEFVDIILKIFCIVPRPDAYKAPAVFRDVPYSEGNLSWYYAITKEAFFRGFIAGYKQNIVVTPGENPFKPGENISRAEAVKVILEALQRNGVIDMGKVPLVEPYYAPYITIAQDLTPYLKQKSLVKKPYIITPGEASKPTVDLTRAEFIAMADRVLQAYDCFTGGSASITSITPNSGPTTGGTAVTIRGVNFSPKAVVTFKDIPATNIKVVNSTTIQAVTPSQMEPYLVDVVITNPDASSGILKDGFLYTGRSPKITDLSPNSGPTVGGTVVTIHGSYFADSSTVSFKADSDASPAQATKVVVVDSNTIVAVTPPHLKPGPVDVVVTNPSFPPTSFKDGFAYIAPVQSKNGDSIVDPRKDLGEGIYAIKPECNTCPCQSSIDHTADVIVGDKLFGIIANDDNSQIFSKSNVIEVTGLPEQNPVNAQVGKP